MKEKLLNLASQLEPINKESSSKVIKLAGRLDKVLFRPPIKSQKAYKYIMYLKFFENIDDALFHKLKRMYLHSKPEIQKECEEELHILISKNARMKKIPSSTIWVEFHDALSKFENDKELWDSYFNLELGKRSN